MARHRRYYCYALTGTDGDDDYTWAKRQQAARTSKEMTGKTGGTGGANSSSGSTTTKNGVTTATNSNGTSTRSSATPSVTASTSREMTGPGGGTGGANTSSGSTSTRNGVTTATNSNGTSTRSTSTVVDDSARRLAEAQAARDAAEKAAQAERDRIAREQAENARREEERKAAEAEAARKAEEARKAKEEADRKERERQDLIAKSKNQLEDEKKAATTLAKSKQATGYKATSATGEGTDEAPDKAKVNPNAISGSQANLLKEEIRGEKNAQQVKANAKQKAAAEKASANEAASKAAMKAQKSASRKTNRTWYDVWGDYNTPPASAAKMNAVDRKPITMPANNGLVMGPDGIWRDPTYADLDLYDYPASVDKMNAADAKARNAAAQKALTMPANNGLVMGPDGIWRDPVYADLPKDYGVPGADKMNAVDQRAKDAADQRAAEIVANAGNSGLVIGPDGIPRDPMYADLYAVDAPAGAAKMNATDKLFSERGKTASVTPTAEASTKEASKSVPTVSVPDGNGGTKMVPQNALTSQLYTNPEYSKAMTGTDLSDIPTGSKATGGGTPPVAPVAPAAPATEHADGTETSGAMQPADYADYVMGRQYELPDFFNEVKDQAGWQGVDEFMRGLRDSRQYAINGMRDTLGQMLNAATPDLYSMLAQTLAGVQNGMGSGYTNGQNLGAILSGVQQQSMQGQQDINSKLTSLISQMMSEIAGVQKEGKDDYSNANQFLAQLLTTGGNVAGSYYDTSDAYTNSGLLNFANQLIASANDRYRADRGLY